MDNLQVTLRLRGQIASTLKVLAVEQSASLQEAIKWLITEYDKSKSRNSGSNEDVQKLAMKVAELEKSASTITQLESKINSLESQISTVQAPVPTSEFHSNLQKAFEATLYALRFAVTQEYKPMINNAAKMIDYNFK